MCDPIVLEIPSREEDGTGREPNGRERMQEYITRGIRRAVASVLWGEQ